MVDKVLATIVARLKETQLEIARNNCMYPKNDASEAGKYQGLELALEIIEGTLRDTYEKELNRE